MSSSIPPVPLTAHANDAEPAPAFYALVQLGRGSYTTVASHDIIRAAINEVTALVLRHDTLQRENAALRRKLADVATLVQTP